jgi:Protein of unknown function (DUF2865)
MIEQFGLRASFSRRFKPLPVLAAALAALALVVTGEAALSQTYDCAGLQAKIAELDRGGGRAGRGAGPSRQQLADLNRTVSYARSLGCDRPVMALFGRSDGRCPGLNAQIQQMQAAIGQLQTAGGPADRAAARADLAARFNAYCRNQPPPQPRQRGFFEQLFGIPGPPETPPPEQPPSQDFPLQSQEEQRPHGGSQAVCVRTCDGGFFPLNIPAHHADPDQLTNLCQALCPNATVVVYTRSPSQTIETSVSLEGSVYSDLPNAGKFEKTFDPSCTCRPPGQSWVEALAGADRMLGGERKTDILVTPEKSAELSAPKSNPRSSVNPDVSLTPPPAPAAPLTSAGPSQTQQKNQNAGATREVTGPDGIKRRVRIVGPTL